MSAPPVPYFGGKAMLAQRIIALFPRTGTGQSARGEWSTRTEVLWSNRPFPVAVPSLFDEVAS